MTKKGPETRDELHALRAKRQREEKRAAAAHKQQKETSTPKDAAQGASVRGAPQTKKT